MTRGKTLSEACGQRWPRLLTPAWAAAYCGMLLPEFRASRWAKYIRRLDGREVVDRFDLDAGICQDLECFGK